MDNLALLMSCDAAPILACQDGYGYAPFDLCFYLTTHYDELLQQLTWKTGCRDRAADALHETWLRLREDRSPRSVGSPKAYVTRMAYHRAIDEVRRDTQHSVVHWAVDADDFDMPDPAPGPDVTLDRRWLLRRLIDAIERLPRQRRAIFVAVRLEDLSQREVAQRYGVSVRKVQGELRKAHAYCEQVLLNA